MWQNNIAGLIFVSEIDMETKQNMFTIQQWIAKAKLMPYDWQQVIQEVSASTFKLCRVFLLLKY